MSVLRSVDLTSYGCPLHYIKARKAICDLESGQAVLLSVNKGDAVKEVMASLCEDGHDCDIIETGSLATIIKVIKS